MSKVRDFAERVLKRIYQLYDSGKLEKGRTLPVESADVGVLVRYESEWAVEALINMLEAVLEDEGRANLSASEDTLAPFTDLMRKRGLIIANTDCIPNHSIKTIATKAFQILADELSLVMNESNKHHAYRYLFPDVCDNAFSYRQYSDEYIELLLGGDDDAIKQYKGEKYLKRDVSELPLSHFIWADEFRGGVAGDVKRTPIVVLSSIDVLLEKIRKGEREVFPGHTSLEVLESKERSTILLQTETSRILSHSKEANDYLNAVRTYITYKQEAILQSVREKRSALIRALEAPEFVSCSTYSNSDASLLQTGWLKGAAGNIIKSNAELRGHSVDHASTRDGSIDIWILADFMSTRVHSHDWKSFIKTLAETDNLLDSYTIPMKSGELDLSIFFDGTANFNNFVKFCFGMNNEANDFSRYCATKAKSKYFAGALLYILTELYIRHRSGSPAGKFTNAVDNITDGAFGYSRYDKTQGGRDFQEFLIDKDYQLDQFWQYCQDHRKTKVYEAFNSSRTKELIDTAILHGPGMADKTATIRGVVLQLFHNNRENETDWRASLLRVKDPTLLALIAPSSPNMNDSAAFKEQVKNHRNYEEGNEEHNRAVLFVFAECYLRKRAKEEEYKSGSLITTFGSWLPKSVQPYDRLQKVQAIRAFQYFMMNPGKRLPNEVCDYFKEIGHPEYESVMKDSKFAQYGNGSDTSALLDMANKVCDKKYFAEERKIEQEALAGKDNHRKMVI